MATAANVSILGYLGSSPSKKEIVNADGEPIEVLNFSVAVNYKTKDSEVVNWYNVESYNRNLEVEWFEKGKQVLINGRMRLEEFTTGSGVEKVVPKIIAQSILFCGKKDD